MRHTKPPTEITMEQVRDPEVWREAVLDAPLNVAPEVYDSVRNKPGAHPDDLLDVCGVALKGGFDLRSSRYRFYGKLAKLEGDSVIVVSTSDSETCWLGTVEQYHQMWCVD